MTCQSETERTRVFPECSEADAAVAAAIHRGEVTPELVDLAHRYASWAARKWWADADDLLSAAMVGAWRFVEHCRHRPQPPAHWRSYAARFIVFRLRDAARAGYGATANVRIG